MYKSTTLNLFKLNDISKEKKFNRTIPEVVLKKLDLSGWHIIKIVMEHHHRAGEPCEPHWRCMVWMKVKNTTKPITIIADMDINGLSRYAQDISDDEMMLLSNSQKAIDE